MGSRAKHTLSGMLLIALTLALASSIGCSKSSESGGPDNQPADWDIFISRSTDNGATWSDVAALNTNAATDTGDDIAQDLATDGAGNWVAVWESKDDLGGTIGADTDILFARSDDEGVTWSDPAPLFEEFTTDTGSDGAPRVVWSSNGAGTWLVIWHSSSFAGDDPVRTEFVILLSRSADGITWTDPIISLDSIDGTEIRGGDNRPNLATDGAGNWIALWQSFDEIVDRAGTTRDAGDILFATSDDDGLTWSNAAPLSTNAATEVWDDSDPQLTTDENGNWVASWLRVDGTPCDGDGQPLCTDESDLDILVVSSDDDGASWTPPVYLNSNWNFFHLIPPKPSEFVERFGDAQLHLATDTNGIWHASWQSATNTAPPLNDSDHDILMTRSIDNGLTWEAITEIDGDGLPPGRINTDWEVSNTRFLSDRDPEVETDRAGNWVAVWHRKNNEGNSPFFDSDIYFALSDDGGLTWSPLEVLNSNASTDFAVEDQFTRLETNKIGVWIVLWQSQTRL